MRAQKHQKPAIDADQRAQEKLEFERLKAEWYGARDAELKIFYTRVLPTLAIILALAWLLA